MSLHLTEEKNYQFDGEKIINVVRHGIMELLTTACDSTPSTGQDTLEHNIPVVAFWTLLWL